ncbi:MAG: hypothetical protein OXH69_11945 [Acidobacteria bacterium]|nr:hypothetical protein [Acidobacteriota bacterium]
MTKTRNTRQTGSEQALQSPRGWRAECSRLRRSDRDAIPDRLGPPEVFSDARGSAAERRRHGHMVPDSETGPESRTVTSRLRMSCAGWRRVPTAGEFYRAVHDPEGTEREAAILLTWCHEADVAEQLDARLEGAYTWRELAFALHRVGLTRGEGARRLNWFARR